MLGVTWGSWVVAGRKKREREERKERAVTAIASTVLRGGAAVGCHELRTLSRPQIEGPDTLPTTLAVDLGPARHIEGPEKAGDRPAFVETSSWKPVA
ncbi:hypothetical protein NDU88_004148 [Pleurodeles waltl]|uniref:Uncharacterized protein n=1 Tax=Pleurodeles waltl TaxID=8319 RepID=A0AAV7WR14_PLEWA|nr:hypothetical protein NDU88_004148 [Pleurodeles waltl]